MMKDTRIKYTENEIQEALGPISSLISKSEKSQQKLKLGSWQHTMLRDNLKALHYAYMLMNKDIKKTDDFTQNDLQEALGSLSAMIDKTENALDKFSPGTSQHTLSKNRLKALCIAKTLTESEVNIN